MFSILFCNQALNAIKNKLLVAYLFAKTLIKLILVPYIIINILIEQKEEYKLHTMNGTSAKRSLISKVSFLCVLGSMMHKFILFCA